MLYFLSIHELVVDLNEGLMICVKSLYLGKELLIYLDLEVIFLMNKRGK